MSDQTYRLSDVSLDDTTEECSRADSAGILEGIDYAEECIIPERVTKYILKMAKILEGKNLFRRRIRLTILKISMNIDRWYRRRNRRKNL